MEITGFEILEKAGEGGMATVWKARQLSLDRIVAIKVLSAQQGEASEDVQMFQTEAQSAAKLKHPGIIQVYDANAENGMYYFIMEFVAGYTVGSWARRSGHLSEENVLLVAECVSDALEYAWEKEGMIHCDIKPDNVMIDDDGSVKLADLGLAKTIFAMGEEESEEVMGTPTYISPEQALGKPDLDFRADIYSLGAMMYHLATGKMMFDGNSEEDVMQMQVTSQVPDAMDLNSEVSQPMCWLLEKMLAKDKKDRHSSWAEVKSDIAKVKSGHMPAGMAGDDYESSMKRSEKRTRGKVVSAGDLSKKLSRTPRMPGSQNYSPILLIAGAAILAIGAVVSAVILIKSNNQSPALPPDINTVNTGSPSTNQSAVISEPRGPSLQEQKEDAAKEKYTSVMKWIAENPEDYKGAMTHLAKFKKDAEGTKFAAIADNERAKVLNTFKKAVAGVLEEINKEASYYIGNGEFEYAADIYRNYKGKLAAETSRKRSAIIEELMEKKASAEKIKREAEENAKRKYKSSIDSICDLVISSKTKDALVIAKEIQNDFVYSDKRNEMQAIVTLLTNSLKVDDVILNSFKSQIGRTIKIQLNSGTKTFTVEKISKGKVYGMYVINNRGAKTDLSFSVDDMSIREKLPRMGSENDPAVALVKGQMAVTAKAYDHAEKYFGMTDPVLNERLVEYLKGKDARDADRFAEVYLQNEFRRMDIHVGVYDEEIWLAALFEKQFSEKEAVSAKRIAETFNVSFGTTAFAKKAKPVIEFISNIKVLPPEEEAPEFPEIPQKNVKEEKPVIEPQPEADEPEEVVHKKREPKGEQTDPQKVFEDLMMNNPGIDLEKVSFKEDEEGNVISLRIGFKYLKDIEPLKGLTHLQSLSLGSSYSRDPMPLKSLEGIEDLPLERFTLYRSGIKDLKPLSGCLLTRLEIHHSPIMSIAPLRNMKLEHLVIRSAPLRDLKELSGMPLKSLVLNDIKAASFRIVGNMKLELADFSRTMFRDLASMNVSALRSLNISDTKENRILILRNAAKLRDLNISNTMIRDISPLKGLPLSSLSLSGSKVVDLTPIHDCKLSRFNMAGIPAGDLSFLSGMPLKSLNISGSKVKSVEMLRDAERLTSLNIANTMVSDIRCLSNVPITSLDISKTKINDFTVMAALPLKTLACEKVKANFAGLSHHKSLYSINVSTPIGKANRSILSSISGLKKVNGKSVKTDGIPK